MWSWLSLLSYRIIYNAALNVCQRDSAETTSLNRVERSWSVTLWCGFGSFSLKLCDCSSALAEDVVSVSPSSYFIALKYNPNFNQSRKPHLDQSLVRNCSNCPRSAATLERILQFIDVRWQHKSCFQLFLTVYGNFCIASPAGKPAVDSSRTFPSWEITKTNWDTVFRSRKVVKQIHAVEQKKWMNVLLA